MLARLLNVGMIPEVWIPPAEVRDLRALVAHRQRLIRQRTQARNRLRSVLHRHNLVPPTGALFGPERWAWWAGLDLPPLERLRVRQDLALLDSLGPLLLEVEEEFMRLSTAEPWAADLPFLVQLPGLGVVTALILFSAIGSECGKITIRLLVTVWTEGFASLTCHVSRTQRSPLNSSPVSDAADRDQSPRRAREAVEIETPTSLTASPNVDSHHSIAAFTLLSIGALPSACLLLRAEACRRSPLLIAK